MAGLDVGDPGAFVERIVGRRLQDALLEAREGQDPTYAVEMEVLARVAGATEREQVGRQVEPAAQHPERLDGLVAGARVEGRFDVADRPVELTLGVERNHRAAMVALHEPGADDIDKDLRGTHRASVAGGTAGGWAASRPQSLQTLAVASMMGAMAGLESLGEFLKEQRRSARLTLRQLADQTGVSNPYLSQIERGLRKPSAEVLQQLAKGLRISAETLYVRAGILEHDEHHDGSVELAVLADSSLTERQKRVLLDIYESFRNENDRIILA